MLKISALLKAKFWKRVSIIYEDQRTWRAVKKHLVRHLTKEGIAISRQIKVEADYLKNGSEVAPKAINSASQGKLSLLMSNDGISLAQGKMVLVRSFAKRVKYPFILDLVSHYIQHRTAFYT